MTPDIPANDHGRIYVFDVDETLATGLMTKTPDALHAAFGTPLDPDYVDVVDTGALAGLTLSDYMAQGYDIPPDGMDKAALNGLKGHVALLMSRAFGGKPATLETADGVTYVSTAATPASFTPTEPLRSESAEGIVPPATGTPPKSDAAIGGRVAMIALIVLFALVGLMLWIAS